MIDDRTSNVLSALEFGPAPLIDARWLHGSSESLTRLRRRAEATADSGCRVIAVTGPTGVGKRRLARWIRHRMVGPTTPAVELDAREVPADAAEIPGPLLITSAERLGWHSAQVLKHRIAQSPKTSLILTSCSPLSTLRARSLDHEQLFGRMTEAILDIPPLHERPDDIGELARAHLDAVCARHDLGLRALSPGALEALTREPLPGSAAQICALLEAAALRTSGRWLTARDLGFQDEDAPAPAAAMQIRLPGSSLREIEIKAITLALRLADHRIVRAAELLGITRHALRRKIDKFGLSDAQTEALDPETSI